MRSDPLVFPPASPCTTAGRRRCLLGLGAFALAGPSWAQGEPGYEWRPWDARRPKPNLELAALDGSRWSLSRQRGQAVLLNFWATWCEPCREEMPSLQRVARRLADRGLRVVAVNYKEAAPAIQRFLQAQGLDLPVLRDADGEAARQWTPRIFPSTVFIDRQGRPSGVLVGAIDWESEAARARIDTLLSG